MMRALAAALLCKFTAFAAADIIVQTTAHHGSHTSPLLHFLFQFGLLSLFLVSIVDSSFVPLPIPGLTDIMVIVMAAQHVNVIALIALSTLGSAIGGYLSYQVGHTGGMAFLEKRVPPSIFQRVTRWTENHAFLAVALPAILPPPMPLSPFVLAAGALNMSRNKFLTTFTISRCLRHSTAAWLGIHYGRHIVRLWNMFSAKYAAPVLITLWTVILISCAYAFWQLYKTSRSLSNQAPTKATA
jgi:membrane protein YqaA with SNARE-associated domain